MPDTVNDFRKRAPNCPSLEQLDRYYCHLLPTEEANTIAKHLAICDSCAAAFEAEETAINRPRSTPRPLLTPREVSTPLPRPPSAVEEPVVFGKYHLVRKLAEGGMGVVYEALEEPLHRVVAVKLVRCGSLAGEAAIQRFRTEAQAVARLEHPHIVRIYDYGEYDGAPYFSMELMAGGSLADKLHGQPLPEREAAQLVVTLAATVQFAHDHQVLHRDLKPGNVLLAADGTVKLSDFGLAKLLDVDSGHTHSDAVLGTPSYMSPEQASGDMKNIDVASDVYGLGAILYELLTAQPPFRSPTRADTLQQVRSTPPKSPATLRPGLAPALEAICLKCLEKEPRHRYASARQLAERLQTFLEGKPIAERPPRWPTKTWRLLYRHPLVVASILLFVLACVSALFAGYYLKSEPPRDPAPETLRTALQNTLRKGNTYEFLGTEKLPGPWRLFGNKNDKLVPAPEDKGFTVLTSGVALLELTSDPGCDRYRFSVELRHDDVLVGLSHLGLYFGGRDGPTLDGQLFRGCYTFTFSDRDGAKNATEFLGKARMRYGFYRANNDVVPAKEIGQAIEFTAAKPIGKLPAPWRKITLEITPDGVRAVGPEIGADKALTVPLKKLQDSQSMLASLPTNPPELTALPVAFQPRAGIGLIVVRGEAAFRHVVLEPLAEKK